MKYLILLFFLISGCSSSHSEPVKSFDGPIDSVENNILSVECSSAVERDITEESTDIGYFCSVEVNEKTLIYDTEGQVINYHELTNIVKPNFTQFVIVTLIEKKDISYSAESRKGLIAEKVTLIEE